MFSRVASINLDMIKIWQFKTVISDASASCHQSAGPSEWYLNLCKYELLQAPLKNDVLREMGRGEREEN